MTERGGVTGLPRAVPVRCEGDIVLARNVGRDVCRRLGFSLTNQTKVATAISELARNIVLYAGSGQVSISALDGGVAGGRVGVEIVAEDQGPGIEDLAAKLAGLHRSRRGLGLGLRGTKRMMDFFEVRTRPGLGTTVTIRMYLR